MNKIGKLNMGLGFSIRMIGMFIMITSLPFFVVNPSNVVADATLAFGGFLLTIGGLIQ